MAKQRDRYGYAESSTLRATVAGPIRSVICADKALENGMHMKMGDLAASAKSDEIYSVSLPAKGDKIALILSALTSYDTSTTLGQHEMFLRKEAGEPARAYYIYEADRYKIADYCITPVTANKPPVVGNKVVVNLTTGFLTEVAASTDTSAYGYVGLIEKIEYKSNLTLVTIKVIKNETVTAASA